MSVQKKSGPIHYNQLENINKETLAKLIKQNTQFPRELNKEIPTVLESVFSLFTEALLDQKEVRLFGVGCLSIYHSKKRKARNLQSNTEIIIPERKTVKLRKRATLPSEQILSFSLLIEKLHALHPGFSKDNLNKLLRAFLAVISKISEGKTRIEIRTFGVFAPSYRAPRATRNPKTGEPLMSESKHAIYFNESSYITEKLNS